MQRNPDSTRPGPTSRSSSAWGGRRGRRERWDRNRFRSPFSRIFTQRTRSDAGGAEKVGIPPRSLRQKSAKFRGHNIESPRAACLCPQLIAFRVMSPEFSAGARYGAVPRGALAPDNFPPAVGMRGRGANAPNAQTGAAIPVCWLNLHQFSRLIGPSAYGGLR